MLVKNHFDDMVKLKSLLSLMLFKINLIIFPETCGSS